jgi:hypothetical protein
MDKSEIEKEGISGKDKLVIFYYYCSSPYSNNNLLFFSLLSEFGGFRIVMQHGRIV